MSFTRTTLLVLPLMHMPIALYSAERGSPLIVYTNDFRDEKDVERVGRSVLALIDKLERTAEFQQSIFYKPDIFTTQHGSGKQCVRLIGGGRLESCCRLDCGMTVAQGPKTSSR